MNYQSITSSKTILQFPLNIFLDTNWASCHSVFKLWRSCFSVFHGITLHIFASALKFKVLNYFWYFGIFYFGLIQTPDRESILWNGWLSRSRSCVLSCPFNFTLQFRGIGCTFYSVICESLLCSKPWTIRMDVLDCWFCCA